MVVDAEVGLAVGKESWPDVVDTWGDQQHGGWLVQILVLQLR